MARAKFLLRFHFLSIVERPAKEHHPCALVSLIFIILLFHTIILRCVMLLLRVYRCVHMCVRINIYTNFKLLNIQNFKQCLHFTQTHIRTRKNNRRGKQIGCHWQGGCYICQRSFHISLLAPPVSSFSKN